MFRKRKVNIFTIIGIGVFIAVAVFSVIANKSFKSTTDTGTGGYVDFIDCGQGDSSLLISEDAVMLIDATTGSEAERVIAHLKGRGIKRIDHLVLTHPHEDHIGGAIDILESFDVGEIYMKKPTNGTEPTTSVYINLLKKLRRMGKPFMQ